MKRIPALTISVLIVLLAAIVLLAGCPATTPTPQPTPKPTAAPSPTPTPTATAKPTPSPTTASFQWPTRMNVTSSSDQAPWISFTAVMQQTTGMNITVVPQATTNLRYKAVQQGEALMTAGSPSDFKAIIESNAAYAAKDAGPWQLRIVWPFSITNSGFMVRKDSGIKTPADLKAGMTVGTFAGSGSLATTNLPAIFAWAGVDFSTIQVRSFSSYAASLQAVQDGQVSLAFVVGTSSATVLPFADDCTLIALDPKTNPQGAQRFIDVWTTAVFMPILEAPPGWVGLPGTGALAGIITREQSDAALIYNIVKWFDINHDKYKGAHPQGKYMTFDNLVELAATSFAPMHPGAIQYLKEKGKWTAANDARQKANVDLLTAYVTAYQDAIKQAEASGIEVIPTNKAWTDLWNKVKTDKKIPMAKGFTGL